MGAKLEPWQQQLVENYIPYVKGLVNREWRQASRELQEDLVQQGYLALVDAVVRFDPDRGTTFGGYAKWRVHKYISEYQQMDETIRKPWAKIKGNEPSRWTMVPLEQDDDFVNQSLIESYGVDEPGYEQVEDEDLARWIMKTLMYYEPETRRLFLQLRQGTLDMDLVEEEQAAILKMLDQEIREGTE